MTQASTTAGALPPPTTKARKQRAFRPCRLDKPHSISAVLPTDVVNRATDPRRADCLGGPKQDPWLDLLSAANREPPLLRDSAPRWPFVRTNVAVDQLAHPRTSNPRTSRTPRKRRERRCPTPATILPPLRLIRMSRRPCAKSCDGRRTQPRRLLCSECGRTICCQTVVGRAVFGGHARSVAEVDTITQTPRARMGTRTLSVRENVP